MNWGYTDVVLLTEGQHNLCVAMNELKTVLIAANVKKWVPNVTHLQQDVHGYWLGTNCSRLNATINNQS